jgi:hypothetical protein
VQLIAEWRRLEPLHIDRCSRQELYRTLHLIGADVAEIEKSNPSKAQLRQIYREFLTRQLFEWKGGESAGQN